MDLIIGSHVSYDVKRGLLGCVEDTINYNANTFMFYTGPNQSTNRSEINLNLVDEAHELMKKNNIDLNNVIVHAPFIINLANNKDERKYNFYISFLKSEIERTKKFGFNKLVFHPGSKLDLDLNVALDNIVNGINYVMKDFNNFTLLIEFMSGKGSEVGSTINDIKYILNNINCKEKIGVCLDTCHLNDSGVDLNKFDEFLNNFDLEIGLEKIKCIHVNDSLNNINSHKDRHANIGYGTIGFDTLINVIYNTKLVNIPKILETPFVNGVAPYKYEINNIKKKVFKEINL